MKAIVMAGGFGSRLYPFTFSCPKPMLPLVNQPVLGHVLDLLKYHNFYDVIITAHYLPEQIQDHFGDGSRRGMTLRYCVEESPLGTAGSVKNAQPYLDDEPFLVISGDIVTNIDLSRVVRFHQRRNAQATLAMAQVADPGSYGVIVTNETGRVQHYLEKPGPRSAISNCVNTGIYVLEPSVLDSMQPDTAYDFSYDIFPQMLQQNAALYGCLTAGYWRDMGTLENYQQSVTDIRAGKLDPMRETTPEPIAVSEFARPERALVV